MSLDLRPAFAGRSQELGTKPCVNTKTYTKPATPMSYGPSIEDLRVSIDRAEAEGIARADMVLRLNFRDASLIKRSPSVSVDEVSFEGGDMRFVGVRIVVGQVASAACGARRARSSAPRTPGQEDQGQVDQAYSHRPRRRWRLSRPLRPPPLLKRLLTRKKKLRWRLRNLQRFKSPRRVRPGPRPSTGSG